MNNTIEELLLAAAIRPIAAELRCKALKTAREAAELQWKEPAPPPPVAYTQADRDAQDAADCLEQERRAKAKTFDADWSAQHPISEFSLQAMAELEAIAAAIS